jgi:hypothetical protein
MSDNFYSSSSSGYIRTHVTSWAGTLPATAGNISYIKMGNQVTLQFVNVQGMSLTTNVIIATVNLPAEILPRVSLFLPFKVFVNGLGNLGMINIDNIAGQIQVNSALAGGNFTPGVTNGFPPQYIRYFTN